jgi:hypothetical protein
VTEADGWIQTASGGAFHVLEPTPQMVNVLDIAHALAHTCRFGGHVNGFYSVAQHCALMVAHLEREGAERDTLRWALLHDVDEAYLPDVPRPVKPFLFVCIPTNLHPSSGEVLPVYMPWRVFSKRITAVVLKRFGVRVGATESDAVSVADLRMLATERRDLMPVPRGAEAEGLEWTSLVGVTPYTDPVVRCRPDIARRYWLEWFRKLFPAEAVPYRADLVIGEGAAARTDGRFRQDGKGRRNERR